LLLPGNGTNGAQNNTFLDSSTNNFTITRNGDTTQGTFSPFSQTGWGAYFDGSNDYLSAPSSSSFNLASSSFTIEVWVYYTSVGLKTIVNTYGGTTTGWALQTNSSSQLTFNASGDGADITGTTALNANQWYHVAVSGTAGSSIKMFLNGTQEGSTYTGNITDASTALLIGQIASSNWFTGYMSNLRIVKGTALYTSNFTPPTSPLTAVSNTVLLTCQSNRFVDNAATPNTITATGGTAITPFSPFAPTSSYSAAAVGGSGYFDGSGDYLSIADNAAFTMGTSDFTVEAWVYCTATDFASSRYIIAQRNASADTSISFAMNFVGGGARKVRLLCFDSGGASYEAACATDVLNLNEWTHIAGVRNGATLRIYVNGVQQGTANISTASLVDSDGSVAIGRLGDANFYYWLGYISNVRITKGGCLYPSGTQFTPPTAPLTTTVSAGTVSLLTNFTNAGVVDATAKNVLETEGNAQISTAQSKWGGGSIYLDGTANTAVKLLTGNQLSPFSGDYTYECWVYFNSFTGTPVIFDTRASNTAVPGLQIYCTTGGVLTVYGGASTATLLITGGTLSTGQWYYIALVRSGSGSNNTKLYLNGSQSGSSATDTTNYNNQGGYIGAGASGTSNYVNGYIDDFRFTRYARTITASPTAPFPVQ
jgi:hypothetical protein